MKKFLKNLKVYLTLIVILAAAVLLILNEYLIYGLIVAGIALLIFWLWQLFVSYKRKEMEKLSQALEENEMIVKDLETENKELRSRRLNISGLQSIMDFGMLEVDTSFTRTWNKYFEKDARQIHFVGALKVNIKAKYGFDLKKISLMKSENGDRIKIAGLIPGFLSFTDINYHWDIAEILEQREPLIKQNYWRKSNELSGLCSELKENFQQEVHQEVLKGPEEVSWLMNPLKNQLLQAMELLLGLDKEQMEIVEEGGKDFISLEEFKVKSNRSLSK